MGKYTTEKKNQVIEEVKEVKSLSIVARKHGIATSTIHGWVKKSNKKIELAPAVKNRELKKETDHLKKTIADQELELLILRDLLKKTTNILIRD